MKIIVGLGNPGKKYEKTRHNLGWLVLNELAGKVKWQENKKARFLYTHIEVSGDEVELIKPTTFMNNSGLAVAYIKKKYNLKLSNVIVVHDDKDLDFGRIKVSKDSSSAGHNGVESIIQALGSKEFFRIRIGIKNSLLEKMTTDKFVLSKFSKEEAKKLDDIIFQAAEKIKENI